MQVLITVNEHNYDNLEDSFNLALKFDSLNRSLEIKVLNVPMAFWQFTEFNDAIKSLQVLINVGVPLNIIETYCKQVGTKFNLTWQQVKLFAEFGGYVDELSVF